LLGVIAREVGDEARAGAQDAAAGEHDVLAVASEKGRFHVFGLGPHALRLAVRQIHELGLPLAPPGMGEHPGPVVADGERVEGEPVGEHLSLAGAMKVELSRGSGVGGDPGAVDGGHGVTRDSSVMGRRASGLVGLLVGGKAPPVAASPGVGEGDPFRVDRDGLVLVPRCIPRLAPPEHFDRTIHSQNPAVVEKAQRMVGSRDEGVGPVLVRLEVPLTDDLLIGIGDADPLTIRRKRGLLEVVVLDGLRQPLGIEAQEALAAGLHLDELEAVRQRQREVGATGGEAAVVTRRGGFERGQRRAERRTEGSDEDLIADEQREGLAAQLELLDVPLGQPGVDELAGLRVQPQHPASGECQQISAGKEDELADAPAKDLTEAAQLPGAVGLVESGGGEKGTEVHSALVASQ